MAARDGQKHHRREQGIPTISTADLAEARNPPSYTWTLAANAPPGILLALTGVRVDASLR